MSSPDEKDPGADDITSGRTRRAFRMGSLTTQVGGNYLWNALKRPFQSSETRQDEMLETHLKNAFLIVERSQELRGAFLKLTQMLSMRTDLLPEEMLNVLSAVQSDVPPMSYDRIREQLIAELGAPPEDLFASFEKEAFAAASLGQVHRARLHDGADVVVKVQYPGVEDTVEQDLKNIKALMHTATRLMRDVLRQKVDLEETYQELEERLREELDYENEARNAQRFAELFADDDEILVPEVFPEHTARRVLTAGYIEGYKLADILKPGVDQELKDTISVKYFKTVWRQIFELGALHTDPHPGNYLVTYHPKLAILDYGSVRFFSEELRRAYRRLARALLDRDTAAAGQAVVDLDFIDPEDDPLPLVQVLDILFEPAYSDRPYDPQDYDSMERAMQAATIKLENRYFKSPGHAVFLGRAIMGLDAYLQQFGSVVNYHRLLDECLREAEERAP